MILTPGRRQAVDHLRLKFQDSKWQNIYTYAHILIAPFIWQTLFSSLGATGSVFFPVTGQSMRDMLKINLRDRERFL